MREPGVLQRVSTVGATLLGRFMGGGPVWKVGVDLVFER